VRYNRIYGTLASLPFSLLWLYISWAILLVGAQVSYVLNSLESYRQLRRLHSPSPACRERLAARLMAMVGIAFQQGQPATLETLAEDNATPEPLADDLLTQMEKAGLLLRFQQTDELNARFIPARPLNMITLHEVVEAVRHEGEEFDLTSNGAAPMPGVEAWLGAREQLLAQGLRGLTLEDIARQD
jgi:membrane protein